MATHSTSLKTFFSVACKTTTGLIWLGLETGGGHL